MNDAGEFDEVCTRDDFVRFLTALARSRREEPEAWENDTVEALLDAMAAWVEDMDGYFENIGQAVPEQPSWRFVVQMLLAARVYQ